MRVAIVVGVWFLLAALALRWFHLRDRHSYGPIEPVLIPGVRTVVWRHANGYELQSFTGTVEGFDDMTVAITDSQGFWVLVEAERIVQVIA